jgi:inosine-uridine nucleoside N-ribohydrolase
VKILLDTDIGSDIDDAICLAYLLGRPDADLLGITTVSGEPVARARMASALCRLAGRDVPVYPGIEQPLLVAPLQPRAQQAEALASWPHAADFPAGKAIEFMRDTILANPGEVTLLAIGPMTNVALLFATYPDVPGLLKSLVLMCGVFTAGRAERHPAEWNARLDPHAAEIVYRAPVARHLSVGLDVTMQVTMPADEVRRRFSHPLLKPVRDFAEVWFRERPTIVFHDPLAATVLFDESLVGFDRGQVSVELVDPAAAGRTDWRPDPTGPHLVGQRVDPDRFFAEFFRVLP